MNNHQKVTSEWIPVSERLPEDHDESVLITVNGTYKNITFEDAIMLAVYDKVEGWILEAYPDWLEPNVTAWIELPEPYKEDCEAGIKLPKKKKAEKVLSNSDVVYILYADGTWRKKRNDKCRHNKKNDGR